MKYINFNDCLNSVSYDSFLESLNRIHCDEEISITFRSKGGHYVYMDLFHRLLATDERIKKIYFYNEMSSYAFILMMRLIYSELEHSPDITIDDTLYSVVHVPALTFEITTTYEERINVVDKFFKGESGRGEFRNTQRFRGIERDKAETQRFLNELRSFGVPDSDIEKIVKLDDITYLYGDIERMITQTLCDKPKW